ncbi:MAG: cobyrinic acid ac-diamide synthase [Rickettsiaceae bacterium]|nr:MAG: cobyrinic acid ac-diamide synthase [Rickettsiaceae bacterium]
MILLIGGEKGGTGKSTVTTNLSAILAHKLKEVLIVDCDPQGTASKWINRRNKNFPNLPKIYCIEKTGNVFDTVKDLSTRYEYVIIDAGGKDSEELRTAMVACNKMYIPLKASQPDIETSKHMSQLVKLAKSLNKGLEATTVISMASTNHNLTEDKEAVEVLSALQHISTSKVIIHERKVYRDAIAVGKAVIECNNSKATEEMNNLYEEVFVNE